MGTSLPTRRFGKAMGINTPCSKPRPKPARWFPRFAASAERCNTTPITNASARTVTMVRRMRNHLVCMGTPAEPANGVEDRIDLASFIAIDDTDRHESYDKIRFHKRFQHLGLDFEVRCFEIQL